MINTPKVKTKITTFTPKNWKESKKIIKPKETCNFNLKSYVISYVKKDILFYSEKPDLMWYLKMVTLESLYHRSTES